MVLAYGCVMLGHVGYAGLVTVLRHTNSVTLVMVFVLIKHGHKEAYESA